MAKKPIRETELYQPVKSMLEAQGYDVKAEIGAVDLVGVRRNEDPVIVELKTGFSLSLVHQAIDRLAITDTVYVAIPRATGKVFARGLKNNITLCRRLGIGLITVRIKDGFTEIHADPTPYQPRKSAKRKGRLLREFQRRVGDPNTGGQTRVGLITAYRQDALKCVLYLQKEGPSKGAQVAKATNVARARNLMAADHYGWFERPERGVYQLSPKGLEVPKLYAGELENIKLQQVKNADC